jgi:hypothetical protein
MKKKFSRIAWLISSLGTLLIGLIACQTQISHTVSTPDTPSGPSTGQVGETLTFSTGGANCSQGHPVEYRFDWGDGTYSSWSSNPTASHSWTAAGTYQVRTQARCSLDQSVISAWSSAKSVTITAVSKLQILSWQLLPYDNMFMPWVIRGYAKNVSGKTLRYAEVRGQFYDANNVLLCSWFDNVTDLAPDVVWEFNIYCMCTDVCNRVHHATVTVGSCW